MLYSKILGKTQKSSKEFDSINATYLIKAGFINQEMAGVYAFLPMGLRVIENIKNIIRKELNEIGGQEMTMTALQSKEPWEKSGRWNEKVVDDWFRTKLKNGTELGLAFTHEEPLTKLMLNYISSYKDLPFYPYQFQTKFRNELRAKSGIIRGREFIMKDLYDFSLSKEDHEKFYQQMQQAYTNIFEQVGIGEKTYLTMSSGGSFSKYSYEFQTISEAGEDTILYDEDKKIAINKVDYTEEIFDDFGLKKADLNFKEAKSIEVGDIYTLGEKYSKALGLVYKDKDGKDKNVYMGSYGIGIPRLMGTVVEVFHDENGIIWPENIAPYQVHLIGINLEDEDVKKRAEDLYRQLLKNDIEVLYDDRVDISAGEKFKDSDLIGIPNRLVISRKTENKVEIKKRSESDFALIDAGAVISQFKQK